MSALSSFGISPMPPIQLVVCDMAGTTVQDQQEVERCFLEAADRTGLSAKPETVISMMGWSKKLVFQTLWADQLGADHADYARQVEASYAQFKAILETHYQTQPVYPTEGCLELFAWLKDHQIKIALTTGFYREVTNIILHRLGWNQGLDRDYLGSEDSIIQASITPSEIYNSEGRPAPFMIQKAMYRLGIVDPKTVINIGDTPADLASGIHANCLFSLGITSGTHTHAQLKNYPNHGLFHSLRDVKEKLASLINSAF
jgi:phosphonatase-like hydrolase